MAGRPFPVAQSKVNPILRPGIEQLLAVRQANFLAIYQESFGWVESEALNVELIDVVGEAIVLLWIDRVEFVNLHEMESSQIRFSGRIDAPLTELRLH